MCANDLKLNSKLGLHPYDLLNRKEGLVQTWSWIGVGMVVVAGKEEHIEKREYAALKEEAGLRNLREARETKNDAILGDPGIETPNGE